VIVPVIERFRHDGRRALVPGLGPRIGSAVAHAFAEAGGHVIATTRTRERVEQVVSTIEGAGGIATGRAGDITDRPFREELLSRCGPIDVLFYAAYALGAGHHETFALASPLDADEADWDGCFRSNLLAPFAPAQALIPA
jgi:NAD(P)-dependent dehydrogenase (short-subunit alcohol dehydrogenase family)